MISAVSAFFFALLFFMSQPAIGQNQPNPSTYIIEASSDSPESLTVFSENVRALGGVGNNVRYIDGRSRWLVFFLIQSDNKNFDSEILVGKDKENIQLTKIPIDKLFVR